jgi:2-iminoacetate synthase ThiH
MAKKKEKQIVISEAELAQILAQAAEIGARKVLDEIGLHDDEAKDDIRDLRSILSSFRVAKSECWKVLWRWITFIILGLLAAGFYAKIK